MFGQVVLPGFDASILPQYGSIGLSPCPFGHGDCLIDIGTIFVQFCSAIW